ncbi:MAG: alpha/beta fold hydrolase [Flavobacteriales bacterium]|nr:alpha/beta fold hydrolase [Flavobacteriales bacterium]
MKLNFTKIGEGSPLLIAHGLFGSSDNWRTLGKQFAKTNTVYLIDLRNHGKSPHSLDMNYDFMASDIMELIIDEKINKPILLGHSMGGKAALMFLKKYPDILEKLIVADIGLKKYPMHHEQILMGLNNIDLKSIKTRSEAQEALGIYVKEIGVQQFLLKNLFWVEKGKLEWRMNLKIIEKNILKILEEITIENSKTPTFFLRGEKSNYIPEEDFKNILNKFPNGKIATIKKVGHWLHAENPDEFFRLVTEFMN